MKLIKPSFEIIPQENGLEGINKHIEIAGRTCYKSEDKITEDSAKEFVDRMIKSGHGAMLEHGTVYLKVLREQMYRDGAFRDFSEIFTDNLYYKICSDKDNIYITTNYRYIIENHLEHWLKYLCEPTEHHEKRVTIKFICDRGVSHEFVRHRVFSFAQESTRYCNYTKDKFDKQIKFILPFWMDEKQLGEHDADVIIIQAQQITPISITSEEYAEICFMESLALAEFNYNAMIRAGWKPQQARNILPNSLKTELIMTGFVSDWKHFFELRCANSAHPQARELAKPLEMEFMKLNLI